MAFNFSPKIVTDGLVLYLDAANTKSYPGTGTSWLDLSKNGNNGTLTNGPTFSSSNGGNIVFDGVNDYTSVNGAFLNSLSRATIEIWVKINNSWSGDRGVSFKGTIAGAGTNHFGIVCRNSNQFIFFADDVSAFKQVNGNNDKQLNVWYNIIGVYNGTQLILYVNGIEEGTRANKTATLNVSSDIFSIGSSSQPLNYYNGSVSSVKIYNRSLSPSEVLQNYNATKTRFGL